MAVSKANGDVLFGSTVNQLGSLVMVATGVGKDTALNQVVRLVQVRRETCMMSTWAKMLVRDDTRYLWIVSQEFHYGQAVGFLSGRDHKDARAQGRWLHDIDVSL